MHMASLSQCAAVWPDFGHVIDMVSAWLKTRSGWLSAPRSAMLASEEACAICQECAVSGKEDVGDEKEVEKLLSEQHCIDTLGDVSSVVLAIILPGACAGATHTCG